MDEPLIHAGANALCQCGYFGGFYLILNRDRMSRTHILIVNEKKYNIN